MSFTIHENGRIEYDNDETIYNEEIYDTSPNLCRICEVEITFAELCAECAKDNEPFKYSKHDALKYETPHSK